jgi:GAF domain-containing protein
VKGHFIGVLNVDSATVNAYDPAAGNTVMAFANQAAIAIENARLFEAERLARAQAETLRDAAKKRAAELEAVRLASLSLTASLELPQVVDAILKSTLAAPGL